MPGLSSLLSSKSALAANDNISQQLPSIEMIQHVIKLVNSVYPNIIYKAYFASNENILERKIDTLESIQLFVYMFDIGDYAECYKLFCSYIEEEVSFSDKIMAGTFKIKPDDTEFASISTKHILPIYSMEFELLNHGKYWGLISPEFANINTYTVFVDRGFYHSKRGVLIVNSKEVDLITQLRSICEKTGHYLIVLNNASEMASKLGCIRLIQENVSEL